MASLNDSINQHDETRSASPVRDEFGEGLQRPSSRNLGGISHSERHSSAFERSEKHRDESNTPRDWAKIEHAPKGNDHGIGKPLPDDRVGTDIDPAPEHTYPHFKGDLPWSQRKWWYQLIPGRGMYYDVRRRLPFLVTDWTTAFEPRNWYTVGQYVVRMYFINLMPALSYIIDMNHRTDGAYGVNEVILASALAAIVFPIFSIQPLTFVGVTGLINLVNYTQYNIVVGYYGLDRLDYLRVQAWSLIWAAFFHFVVAIFNISDYTRFITDMTSETFGFYVGVVYIQKGIELLILEYEPAPLNNATGWFSVTIAILFTVSVYLVTKIGGTSFLPFRIRYFVSSFAFAAGCVFWTGFSHFPKNSMERIPIQRLPITKSFFPSIDRPWFIDFWNIELRWVFVGAPLGFLIMILFYFDHNVSSVMAQARQFPVKRPAGFHWDFFLLGITTLVSGFLGLPAPNGLVPQCPWSTDSLSVYKQVDKGTHGSDEEKPLVGRHGKKFKRQHIVNVRVVENRAGHLLVGLLTLATMTRPFLVALGTMPRALFAGIFILVGWSSIEGNTITRLTLALFHDRRLSSYDNGLLKVKRSKIALYVGIQWVFFALTIAISQTIAAIGFPVIIVLLIPFRYYVVPKWFSPRELRILDAPTANADVVLASLGHETEAVTGQGMRVARDTNIAGSEWPESDDDDAEDEDHGGRSQAIAHGHERGDVNGYTIDNDEDDDADNLKRDDQQGRTTPFTDIDPEGHYRNWVDQTQSPSLGGSAALGGTAAGIHRQEKTIPEQQSAEKPQIKGKSGEKKRAKSVTQSWWGHGGSQSVQRTQNPLREAATEKSNPADQEATQGKEGGAMGEAVAATAAGGGLGAWLARKKQSKTGTTGSKETKDQNANLSKSVEMDHAPPIASSQGSANLATDTTAYHLPQGVRQKDLVTSPGDLPGANVAEPSVDQTLDSRPSLFASMAQSPSEAGTIAAAAVRDIQEGRQTAPSTGPSTIAMPSNIPNSLRLPHNSEDQHQISIDPTDPHHIHVASPHPGTSIDINRDSVQLLREGETSRIDRQTVQRDDRKETAASQQGLTKEEEKLQSLLSRQARHRQESETKREKLQSQLRAIEEKAAFAAAAGAVGGGTSAKTASIDKRRDSTKDAGSSLVPKIQRAELTALSEQVAGHEDGIYSIAQNSYVVKPCNPIEVEFYEKALLDTPRSMSKSQRTQLKRLRTFLPTFHGVIDIVSDMSGSMDPILPTSTRAVLLENLSRDYNYANVLDVKLGRQLWDESATSAKRARMDEVAATTTSGSTGIRLTGWRTWDPTHATFTHVDKTFGKSIQTAQLETGLRCFFGLGSDADAQVVSDHSRQRYSPPQLPAKNLEAIIYEGILPAIDKIIDIVKKMHWRMRGGSLLITFEGDPAVISMVNKNSDLWAGRRSTEKDSQVDLSSLDRVPIVAPALRLVDVRLIDFAHTRFAEDDGRDEGLLAGLETLRNLLARIAKDARKGKIGQKTFGVANDSAAPVSGIGEPVLVAITRSRLSTDIRPNGAAPFIAADKTAAAPAASAASREPEPVAEEVVEPAAPAAPPASAALTQDDAQSSRSEKRKSRGFLGMFRSKSKKNFEDSSRKSENAASQSSTREATAKKDSSTLPPFAFEEENKKKAQSNDKSHELQQPGSIVTSSEVAAGTLGAVGLGSAAIEAKQRGDVAEARNARGGSVTQSTDLAARPADQAFAQPVPEPVAAPVAAPVAQPVAEPIAEPVAEPVAAASLPMEPAGKGKARAVDSEDTANEMPVSDEMNQQREHPHGTNLNSILHKKGKIDQSKDGVITAQEATEAKKDSADHKHDEAVAGAGAALIGTGILASNPKHEDDTRAGKAGDPQHSERASDDETGKKRGLLGLFGKTDAKKSNEREASQANSTADGTGASGVEKSTEAALADRDVDANAADAEGEEKGRIGIIDLLKVGAPAPLDLMALHGKDKHKSTEDAEPQAVEASGSAIAPEEAAKEESTVPAATAMEAARGQSQAQAEKQLEEEAEAREAYHQRAIALSSSGGEGKSPASPTEPAASSDDTAAEESPAKKQGGILAIFKSDKSKEGEAEDTKAETAPASAMEAARGESAAQAETRLREEAAAREAYHKQAVATAESKKGSTVLGLFRSDKPKDNHEEALASGAAPAAGEAQAETETSSPTKDETSQTPQESVSTGSQDKAKLGVLGLFTTAKSQGKTDDKAASQVEEAQPSAMEAARGKSQADAEAKLDDEAEARQAYHERAIATSEDDAKKGGILALFKKGAPAPLESTSHHGKKEDSEASKEPAQEAVHDAEKTANGPPAPEPSTSSADRNVSDPTVLTEGAIGGGVAALALREGHKKADDRDLSENVESSERSSAKAQSDEKSGILGLFKTKDKTKEAAAHSSPVEEETRSPSDPVQSSAQGEEHVPAETSARRDLTTSQIAVTTVPPAAGRTTTAENSDAQHQADDTGAVDNSRPSIDSRRHGIMGLFKKSSKQEESLQTKPRAEPGNAAKSDEVTSAGNTESSTARSKTAEEVTGAGLIGAAVVGAERGSHRDQARQDAQSREKEAEETAQKEQIARQKDEERKLLAEAAATKRKEAENANLREKKAQEDAKLRGKKEKQEAKLEKKRAKEQAKADKLRAKAERKKAEEEEKHRLAQEKAAEKERIAAAAALEQKRREELKEQKRKEEQKAKHEAQQKKAQEETEALEARKREAAGLEAQRKQEAAEFEKRKAEMAEIEKQRSEERKLLDKQRKEAIELQQKLKEEESGIKKQREELAALQKQIQEEQAAIQEQRQLALQLQKQREEGQTALESKHDEAAVLQQKRVGEAAALEQRQTDVAEADKALQDEKEKLEEQQRRFQALEEKRKEDEAALVKQKEESARVEKQQQAEAAALEKGRKETEALEKKRKEDEAVMQRQKAEAAELQEKRIQEEELAKKQRDEAAEVHKRLQEEEDALKKAREELAATEKARKKEQAELDAEKKEASKLHKKAEKEEAALKYSQKETAKIHEKLEKEKAALEKAQAEAAAADKARQEEKEALEAKKKEREQQRESIKASAHSDVNDEDDEDHSTLKAIAAGVAAVPIAGALLHSSKDEGDDEKKSTKSAKPTTSAPPAQQSPRPSRFFASLRRKSRKASEDSSVQAKPIPPAAQTESVNVPSFSGAPAGGAVVDSKPLVESHNSTDTAGPAEFGKGKARETVATDRPVEAPALTAMSTVAQTGSSPVKDASESAEATTAPDAEASKEKDKSAEHGGFFGLFKSRGDSSNATHRRDGSKSKLPVAAAVQSKTDDDSPAVPPPSKEPGFVKVGRGTKGVANEEEAAGTQSTSSPTSSWPAPRKSMDSNRTTGSKRSKRSTRVSAPGAATAATAAKVAGGPMTTVEEVVEQTKDGTRKYIVHTNPTRGPGKAPSAVQWRNPFHI